MSNSVQIPRSGVISFGTVQATGPLGPALQLSPYTPSDYTFDWSTDGTPATQGTFQPEGSSDETHWFALSDPQDFTQDGMFHITNKPVAHVRINVLTYVPGDQTTATTFRYTKKGD